MAIEKKNITCIISSKNEELRIAATIKSAKKIAENIIVLDNNSSDNTVSIARQMNVHVVNHSFDVTSYRERISLGIGHAKKLYPHTKYITHLNCSEEFIIEFKDISKLLVKEPTALNVYRQSYTNNQFSHPMHLVYLLRAIFKTSQTFRFVRIDQWSLKKCEIHKEFQVKNMKNVAFLSVLKCGVKHFRDGKIDITERKHLEYAAAEAEKISRFKYLHLLFAIFRAIVFLIYNVPYLLFRYSDDYALSIILHMRYFILVGIIRSFK